MTLRSQDLHPKKMTYCIEFNQGDVQGDEEFQSDCDRNIYYTKEMPLESIETFIKIGNINRCDNIMVSLKMLRVDSIAYKDAEQNTEQYLNREPPTYT